jgi:HEPN domain-containing protein
METQPIMPDHDQAGNFKLFIEALVHQFNPLQIICFARTCLLNETDGSFKEKEAGQQCDYFLLMVTESNTRGEVEAQEFADSQYHNGKITILVHKRDVVTKAIAANSRFFITVYNTGQLLYSRDGMAHMGFNVPFIPLNAGAKAARYFNHRMLLVDGFLSAAETCLATEEYNIAGLMLHQAVEQCCMALIRVHMAYRSDTHDLHSMLSLCTCFSFEPLKLFLSGNAEDERIFDVLIKSYIQTRYVDDFWIKKVDAEQIYNKVLLLIVLTRRMCMEKIEKLENESLLYKQLKQEAA